MREYIPRTTGSKIDKIVKHDVIFLKNDEMHGVSLRETGTIDFYHNGSRVGEIPDSGKD